mmetsp:Transcript_11924/g.29364  ORF Transcript_11924/g.29364 Transcript_11924/m.29364 type:complete len:110 (-) Transcript_11924:442-771(-)
MLCASGVMLEVTSHGNAALESLAIDVGNRDIMRESVQTRITGSATTAASRDISEETVLSSKKLAYVSHVGRKDTSSRNALQISPIKGLPRRRYNAFVAEKWATCPGFAN